MSPTASLFRPLASVLIAVVATACSGQAPGSTIQATPVDASSDAWLVAGHGGKDGLQVFLASSGERLLDLPTGIPDATWGRLVTASSDGTKTVVKDLVVQPGFGGADQTFDGAWRLPTLGADPVPVGVSDDGRTIVLVEDAPAAQAAPTTRFAILRRTFDVNPRIVELAGSFEYDTLSPDGKVLYVIEHLAGPPDGHYQVRAVDTGTGTLREEVIADKTGDDEAMAGWPIAQARRPDGMVFTLYQGPEHPFIHALSSIDVWALCIDLPATAADDPASAADWGLTATVDGRSLVAANATLGLAVEIPLADLAVRRSVTFAPSASSGISLAKFGHQAGGVVGRRIVASPLGSVVYAAGPGGIVSIGTSDLALKDRFLEGVAVDAIAVTPDGGTIYALLHAGGRIVRLDAATGLIGGEVPGGGYDRLVAVVPW